jgi:hypothetical protein
MVFNKLIVHKSRGARLELNNRPFQNPLRPGLAKPGPMIVYGRAWALGMLIRVDLETHPSAPTYKSLIV